MFLTNYTAFLWISSGTSSKYGHGVVLFGHCMAPKKVILVWCHESIFARFTVCYLEHYDQRRNFSWLDVSYAATLAISLELTWSIIAAFFFFSFSCRSLAYFAELLVLGCWILVSSCLLHLIITSAGMDANNSVFICTQLSDLCESL